MKYSDEKMIRALSYVGDEMLGQAQVRREKRQQKRLVRKRLSVCAAVLAFVVLLPGAISTVLYGRGNLHTDNCLYGALVEDRYYYQTKWGIGSFDPEGGYEKIHAGKSCSVCLLAVGRDVYFSDGDTLYVCHTTGKNAEPLATLAGASDIIPVCTDEDGRIGLYYVVSKNGMREASCAWFDPRDKSVSVFTQSMEEAMRWYESHAVFSQTLTGEKWQYLAVPYNGGYVYVFANDGLEHGYEQRPLARIPYYNDGYFSFWRNIIVLMQNGGVYK